MISFLLGMTKSMKLNIAYTVPNVGYDLRLKILLVSLDYFNVSTLLCRC